MVAGSDDVDAGGIELGADRVGDAEAMRRVLAIGDDKIETELAPQARHVFDHHAAAGTADDVAAKHEPHAQPVLPYRRRDHAGRQPTLTHAAAAAPPLAASGNLKR